MKQILGHKSYTSEEVIDILKKASCFTCCTLPHRRYDRVKDVCRSLERLGLVRRSGTTDCAVNLVVTDLFRQWQKEFEAGVTALGPIKWKKEKSRERSAIDKP